jgi:cytochrome c553
MGGVLTKIEAAETSMIEGSHSLSGHNLRRASVGILFGGLLILAGCASGAKPDAVAGTVHVCSSCHGMDGKSVSPTFPRLAGQQKDYLVAQLKAFRDHTRADPHAHTYMWGMAASLSDATIDGVADYYSSLSPVPGKPTDGADIAAGKKIYEEGIPEQGVPACGGCHGDAAQGGGTFPRLAGQHRPYIEGQLAAFASNARANEIMHENAKNLTPDTEGQLAAFLATQ